MDLEKFECDTTRAEVLIEEEGGFQSQQREGANYLKLGFTLGWLESRVRIKSLVQLHLSYLQKSMKISEIKAIPTELLAEYPEVSVFVSSMSHFKAEIPSCSHQVRGVSEILLIFILLLLSVSLGGLYSLLLWGWMLGKQLLFIFSICCGAGYACLFWRLSESVLGMYFSSRVERFVFLMGICFIYHMLDLFIW